MVSVDRLDPLPAVVCGSTTVLVDRFRPVAVLRAADASVRVVTWPDAPLPARSVTASVLAAPGCVWVVYSEDSMDGPADSVSTAVRVGVDGQVATCELGVLQAIGADDEGVWLSPEPYLAMEQAPADQDGEGPGDDGEVFEGPPSWVQDAPVEAWEDFERVERETSDAQAAGGGERFLAASPEIGEGESFGWFAYAPGSEPPPSAPAPEPPAPAPTGAVTLHRLGAGGEREQMVVSRVVSRIQAVGAGVLRLVFHPTGPVYTADDRGGHFVDYPQRIAEVDVSAGLPATLDLDAAPSQPVQDEGDNWEWDEEPAIDEADRVDLSGIAGTRWSLRPISAGDVEAAVAAVRAQYTDLDEPHLVHTRRDDRWHRVQSEYADVEVHTEGAWPDLEVVVDFGYRPAPGRSFRRRTRVFDDAGAPVVSPYLSVYLDEDLATTDLDQLPLRDGRLQV